MIRGNPVKTHEPSITILKDDISVIILVLIQIVTKK